MIDPSKEEQALQFILGGMSLVQRVEFEAALRNDPELMQFVRETEDALAAYASSIEQHAAPAHVLENTRQQLREEKKRALRWQLVRPLAIAAIFTVTCVGAFMFGRISAVGDPDLNPQTSQASAPVESVAEVEERPAHRMLVSSPARSDSDLIESLRQRVLYLERQEAQSAQKELVLREALHEMLRRSPESLRSPDFLARLEDALNIQPGVLDTTMATLIHSLARRESKPGVAQLTVLELSHPDYEVVASLAPVATDIISEAFWEMANESGDDILTPTSSGSRLALDAGGSLMITGSSNMFFAGPEGVAQGESGQSAADILSELGLQGASNPMAIPQMDMGNATDIAAQDAGTVPLGFAVWDETNRSGSLNLRHLPELMPEQNFQLWGLDATGQSFSIGLLDLKGGDGRVAFNLSAEEPLPAKLIITVEPVGGSEQPGGQVILQSPTTVELIP